MKSEALTTGSKASFQGISVLIPRSVRNRMQGPGGYYNLGNAFGLLTGVMLQIALVSANGVTASGTWQATADYLAGGPSAIALTVSMLIFFWSGELYHRAWCNGFPPVKSLNRAGDLWSCWGALVLGIGLLLLGQPWLALTAGLLHAAGKYGSAQSLTVGRFWPAHWPDFWRTLVLVSRVPALIAVVIEISGHTQHGTLFTLAGFGPLTLLVCYLLWVKADWMLYRD